MTEKLFICLKAIPAAKLIQNNPETELKQACVLSSSTLPCDLGDCHGAAQ